MADRAPAFSSLLLLLLVLLCTTTSSLGHRSGFDYFILSLQWPGTMCESHSACCSTLSNSTGFTIHGLWPEYRKGGWPQCCKGPTFDEKKIVALLGDLSKYWPTLICSSATSCHRKTKISFWGHEWEKHGTCAYPIIQDEFQYFAVTIQLYAAHNLLTILEESGFTPISNEEYETSALVAAITKAVGATPSLVCSNKRLKEVRLCLSKEFKAQDCGETFETYLSGSSSCPKNILIPPLSSSIGLSVEPKSLGAYSN